MWSPPALCRFAVLVAVLALSACAQGSSPAFVAGLSEPSSPSIIPTKPSSGSATSAPYSLEWYLAQVPTFSPSPRPEPVDLGPSESTPIWSRLPTDQAVAFITIDDGVLARPDDVPAFVRKAHIPVTMFLNSPAASTYTDYFIRMEAAGAVVENHTVNHPSLRGTSYNFQKREICDSDDKLEELFGRRPTLFRPPFGEYDNTTIRVAHECGAKAIFDWTETVDKGIVRFQTAEKVVKPGDVLLMHFRPALMDDLLAALKAIHDAGLTPALLEDYVR